jgi:hypothetical protein
MMKKINPSRLALAAGALALIFGFSAVHALAVEPGTVTMTVTAVGKKDVSPPIVNNDDVQLYLNKERTPIADWRHADKLYLAVLIDDSLESEIANQWGDLKAFLAAQPSTTYVSVSYARNGTAVLAQDFTNDHELAAKALRIPVGNGGAFSSPYLALLDLEKRLPGTARDRREILVFSSGIDYFRGDFWIRPTDLDSVISRAQKQNINIWSIYAPDEGHRARGFFITSRAQSYLSMLSDQTGAESYYLGTGSPVTFKPYFDELATHLSNQYLLTFKGGGGAKGRFERVHLATEVQHVEFLAAPQAFLPPVQ